MRQKCNFAFLTLAVAALFPPNASAQTVSYIFTGELFDASDVTKNGLKLSGSISLFPALLTEVYDASANQRSGSNASCANCPVVSSAAVTFSDGTTISIGNGTYNFGEISVTRNWTSRATGHTGINSYEIGAYENPVIDGDGFTYSKGIDLLAVDYLGVASPMFGTTSDNLSLSQIANWNYGAVNRYGYIGGDDWYASINVLSVVPAVDDSSIIWQLSLGLSVVAWASRKKISSGA